MEAIISKLFDYLTIAFKVAFGDIRREEKREVRDKEDDPDTELDPAEEMG